MEGGCWWGRNAEVRNCFRKCECRLLNPLKQSHLGNHSVEKFTARNYLKVVGCHLALRRDNHFCLVPMFSLGCCFLILVLLSSHEGILMDIQQMQ